LKVAIVVPHTSGGVSTIYNNLLRAFIKDKIPFKVFKLQKMLWSIQQYIEKY